MPMRPFAPAALLIVALVGCGVPDASIPAAKAVRPQKVEGPTTDLKKLATEAMKAAEQDPAKLGMKIVDAKVGDGAVAEPGDTCVMKYAGRLKSNGEEFDSNMKPDGKPFTFTLGGGQVIKGWDIGVKGMKVGGKRTLEIPPDLAYGSEAKTKIPANSTLLFDIELVDLQKRQDASTVLRETVTPGSGPAVENGDMVTIRYKITLADGTMVDDNGGKPAQFKVGAPSVTIRGLNIALVGMKKGQAVRATIPPALGMPPGGPESKVPPGSTIKMDITLVKIG